MILWREKEIKDTSGFFRPLLAWEGEGSSRKFDLGLKSLLGIRRDGSGMGALVVWARAARCETASRRSCLLAGGAMSERGASRHRLHGRAGFCLIVVFVFNCNVIWKDCICCPQTFPEQECQPDPWRFCLYNCSDLVWEETVFWTLEETSCVWFATDKSDLLCSLGSKFHKEVSYGVLKTQRVMILHSNFVYSRVS